jgi:hypothetical protein
MDWQNASGYTKPARVEAAIGRYKGVISDGLCSRTDRRRGTEVVIVLNPMPEFGRWFPFASGDPRRGRGDCVPLADPCKTVAIARRPLWAGRCCGTPGAPAPRPRSGAQRWRRWRPPPRRCEAPGSRPAPVHSHARCRVRRGSPARDPSACARRSLRPRSCRVLLPRPPAQRNGRIGGVPTGRINAPGMGCPP